MDLYELSDDALVSQLAAICLEGHRLTARLVEYLIEVEERRLDLKAACTSMFDFCVRRLGMSEGASFQRINAARLVRRFPPLLGAIETGELSLSTLVLLRPHLMHVDEAQAVALAAAVAGMTQREVEAMLARRAPRPDVPSSIVEVLPAAVQVELGSSGSEAAAAATATRPTPERIEPLSASRFKVQLTASEELKEKLERARDLMSHRNPSGDLAVVVELALDLLLTRLERGLPLRVADAPRARSHRVTRARWDRRRLEPACAVSRAQSSACGGGFRESACRAHRRLSSTKVATRHVRRGSSGGARVSRARRCAPWPREPWIHEPRRAPCTPSGGGTPERGGSDAAAGTDPP